MTPIKHAYALERIKLANKLTTARLIFDVIAKARAVGRVTHEDFVTAHKHYVDLHLELQALESFEAKPTSPM